MVVGTRRFNGGALVAATAMVVSLGVGGTAQAAQLDPAPTASDTGRTSRAATLPAGWTLSGDVLTWASPVAHPDGWRPSPGDPRRSRPRAGRGLPRRTLGVGAAQPGRHGRPDDRLVGARGRRVGAPPRRRPGRRPAGPYCGSGGGVRRDASPGRPAGARPRQGRAVPDGHRLVLAPRRHHRRAHRARGGQGRRRLAARHHRCAPARPVPPRPPLDVLPRGRRVDGRLAVPRGLQADPEPPRLPRDPAAARVAGLRHRVRSRPTGSTARTGCSPTAAPRRGPS